MMKSTTSETVRAGRSFPPGSSVDRGGVNFSVYSRAALEVDLLLFDEADDAQPVAVISMNPRSGTRPTDYWQC